MKEVNGERVEGLSFVETRAKTLRLCYFYLHNVDTWSLPDNGPTADPMPIRAASSDMPARIASASSEGRESTAPACLSLDMPGRASSAEAQATWARSARKLSALGTMVPSRMVTQGVVAGTRRKYTDARTEAAKIEKMVLAEEVTLPLIQAAIKSQMSRCEQRAAGLSMLSQIVEHDSNDSNGLMLQVDIDMCLRNVPEAHRRTLERRHVGAGMRM